MPTITIITIINAPVERCFDLSRSIDLHVKSTEHTGETAIAGRTTGLIELNESVTWQAKHLGVWQTLTSRITVFNRPDLFVDEMTDGAFEWFSHQHHFASKNSATIMTDIFAFESPFGIGGKVFNVLFLTKYMQRLLEKRNAVIKECAESDKWKQFIPVNDMNNSPN